MNRLNSSFMRYSDSELKRFVQNLLVLVYPSSVLL